MGAALHVMFAAAPVADVAEAIGAMFSADDGVAVGAFEGAAGWTCVVASAPDLWSEARLGALSRAVGGECWSFDVTGTDSMRVRRADGGRVARAGFLNEELDAGMEFEASMTLPVLNDVTIGGACDLARAGGARDAAALVERLARDDVADVQAAIDAIAIVFGGERHALVGGSPGDDGVLPIVDGRRRR